MIGVDTNVLLRYVIKDDLAQFERADAFFKQCSSDRPAYVSMVVLAEFIWVLQRYYRYSTVQVLNTVNAMLDAAELNFEMEEHLAPFFARLKPTKGDIADCLIAFCAVRAGCSHTVTFDRRAAGAIPEMELLA